jgi:hypothetical protein
MLPDVPVRQWVLTLPLRLRYRLAWDHDLCRAVVGVFVHAVFATLRRRAAWDGIAGGRSGADGLTALDAAETLQHVHAGITHLVERWRHDDAGWMDDAPATSALAAAV